MQSLLNSDEIREGFKFMARLPNGKKTWGFISAALGTTPEQVAEGLQAEIPAWSNFTAKSVGLGRMVENSPGKFEWKPL